MTRAPANRAPSALALLRVITGVILIVGAANKMKFHAFAGVLPLPVASLAWQLELPIRLAAWLANHPSGIVAAIVRDLLLPNGPLFAGILTWSEISAGILLVIGLRTRGAGVLAMLICGALVLAGGGVGSIGGRPYLLLGAVALVLVIGDAGVVAGIDGWRRERRRDRNL